MAAAHTLSVPRRDIIVAAQMQYAMDCVQQDLRFNRMPVPRCLPHRCLDADNDYACQWISRLIELKSKNVCGYVELEKLGVQTSDRLVIDQRHFEMALRDLFTLEDAA